jgi:hypothetical protein
MKNVASIPVLFVAASLIFGCATVEGGRSGAASTTRGSMIVHGRSAKAVVHGPAVIHAYAVDRGGSLYTVPVVTGSDSDCIVPSDGLRHSASIRPDQRVVQTIEPGEMACLATSVTRDFELLWHAHKDVNEPRPAAQVALTAHSHGVK